MGVVAWKDRGDYLEEMQRPDWKSYPSAEIASILWFLLGLTAHIVLAFQLSAVGNHIIWDVGGGGMGVERAVTGGCGCSEVCAMYCCGGIDL